MTSISPNLNSIENFCEELSRWIYSGGKTYDGVNKLKDSVFENWHNISMDFCKKLIDFMENRIKLVIENNDNSIDYLISLKLNYRKIMQHFF